MNDNLSAAQAAGRITGTLFDIDIIAAVVGILLTFVRRKINKAKHRDTKNGRVWTWILSIAAGIVGHFLLGVVAH